jgi:gliding motility-associated-like protein
LRQLFLEKSVFILIRIYYSMSKKIFFVVVLILTTIFRSFSQGDDCTTATQITNLSNNCSSNGTYTNVPSTASTYSVPSCWNSSSTIDVWFKFVAVGSDVLITVNGSGKSTGATMQKPEMVLSSGTCGSAMSEIACNTTKTSGDNFVTIYRGALTLGATYYIRIASTSTNKGKFDLCINNYTPVPNPNDPNDCNHATIVCNKDALSVGTFNGAGSLTNETNLGCFSTAGGESNSNWLTFTCKTSGTLDFDINGAKTDDDIDWMFMEIPAKRDCSTKTVLSCNLASCDINGDGSQASGAPRKTGIRPGESAASLNDGSSATANSEFGGCTGKQNGYNDELNIVAGKSYVLFINNDVASTGFSVTWTGTSTFVGPESKITVDKTSICVGESVSVNGTSSLDYTTFKWDLPTEASPTTQTTIGPFNQTFNATGTYPIVLTTYDNNGCLSVKNQNITVNGINPDFTAPSVCSGNPTIFTNTTPSVTSCSWNFGDSQTGTGTTVNHTYSTPGQYNATLTVTGGGCTNVFTKTVSVLGATVAITPTSPSTCPGTPLTLSGTATVTGSVSGTKSFSSTGSVSVPKTDGYSVGVDTDWNGSVGNSSPSYASSNIGTSIITTTGISNTSWSINSVTLNISTTKAKFLTVYLETPCGGRIKLVAKTNSLTGAFSSTVFTPTASTALSGALGAGPYAASELSKWNSNLLTCTNPNGSWKLLVAEYVFGSTGNTVITGWSMDFTTSVPNTLKTLAWSPTTNLSSISYTGLTTLSGTASASTSTAEQITLTAKDDAGCTTTNKVTISVSGPPAPTCANASVCSGGTTTLTATGNSGATFKWYSAATGGTLLMSSASYTTPAITGLTSFWVTQSTGTCESPRTQVDVTLKTVETPVISCGTSTTSSVDFNWAANTDASSYTLSYNPGTGIQTSSQAGLTKTISGLTSGQTIALTVTPVGTGCYSPATFSCTANNCPSPTITTQPVNSTKCSGTSTSFSVVQTGGSTFKWQVSTNGGTSFTDVVASSIYSGVTSTTLSISDVSGLTGYKYQLVISPAVGTCVLTSTAALLTVNPLPTATISGDVSQCENVSSPSVIFTGANGAAPYTFGYSKNGLGGPTITTTSGNTASVSIPATPASITTFGITSVTDNNGCTQNVTGQNNTITIKAIETPTLSCGSSTTSSASFNWTACSAVTDYSISYNNGSGPQSAVNQTGLSYTITGLPAGGSGSITVTPNGTGCFTAATLSCTANNCPSPTIDTHPSPSIKCAGAATSFTIAQTGGATIQWLVSTNGGANYTNITPSSIYSGETSLTLSISDVTGLNGYLYKAKVTEAGGTCSVTSNSALLTVNVIPTATISGTTAVCSGKSSDLSIALTGVSPWNYSYSDGTTTSSKTAITSSPSTISVSPSSTTTYNLVSVSDANCAGTVSGSTIVTIKQIPVVSAILDTTLCHKTNKPTTVFTSTPTGATFDWTNTDASIGLGSSGTGDIAQFEVQNTTASPITNTIEVTPTLAGCVGSPIQFHLTINPFLTTKITATDSTMNSISYAWTAVNGATSYDVSTALNPVNAATTYTSVSLPNPLATTYTHGGLKMGDKVELKVSPKGAVGTCYLPATLIAMTDSCKKATILTQPKTVSKCISETASFTFIAKGNDSISGIKWQESKDGITWTDLANSGVYSGVKTSGLFINNLAGLNGNKYRASILGTINSCEIFTNVVDLNVFPIPTPNFIVDKTTGCAPLSVKFTDQSGYNDATITWDFGDGSTLTKKVDSDLDEVHTFQIPDSFNVSLIVNRNGCIDTVQTKITVMTPAIAKFKMDKTSTSLLDPTVALTNLSSNNSVIYKWTFDDNSPISTLTNPNHTFVPTAGDYKIILYTSSIDNFSDTSCISVYEQKFTILDDVIYYIPNTFTPNGDEVNNTFQPVFFSGFDPQHYYFSIYNRWGEIIFESFNPAYGWDGTYGNKMLESATYVWKLQFKEKQNDKEHYLTGHLNLIK